MSTRKTSTSAVTFKALELEKEGITSYEDGWDEWDGPIWPWREDCTETTLKEAHPGK